MLPNRNDIQFEVLYKPPLVRARESNEEVIVTTEMGASPMDDTAARMPARGATIVAGTFTGVALREHQCWRSFSLIVTVSFFAGVVLAWYLWHRTVADARDPATGRIREYTFPYFLLCFIGGGFAGLAHVFVTPIDVVKCRMQVGEYKSMTDGFKTIYNDAKGSCLRALPLLFRGWLPTIIAYGTQCAVKFALYEMFKYWAGRAWLDNAPNHGGGFLRLFSYLLSSALAEFFADFCLAPFETVKVKVQTTSAYPTDLQTILPRIWTSEGWNGFYKGLVPLWFRQIPYTMVKFASFEKIVQLLTSILLSAEAPPPSSATQLAFTLLAGVLAGMLCAVVSHPADTLVSKMSQRGASKRDAPALNADADGKGMESEAAGCAVTGTHSGGIGGPTSLMGVARELGWGGLWRGLLPRLAMVGFITAIQWLMYDAFKIAAGLPTTGGGNAARKRSRRRKI